MATRPARFVRGLLRSDSLGAAGAAASATLVTRAALPKAAGADATLLLLASGLLAAIEVAAALARRRAGPGPLARSRAGALARLAVALAALLAASGLSSTAGAGGERGPCLAALLLVLLLLPAAPLAGARLLEAELARRMPQLVAGRLVARLGTTAALAVPAALLLLPRVRADAAALAASVVLPLFLLGGVRRARDDAFVRELDLQARRAGAGRSEEPRDALRPLTPEQFQSFRDECERRSRRR